MQRKVIIDHHLDPGDFADLIISDPSKCSTSELVHELICEMNRITIYEQDLMLKLFMLE